MTKLKQVLKNRRVKTLVKFIFVGVLLYFLARRGFLSLEETGKAFTRWRYTVPSLFIMATCTLLGVTRWKLLLDAQGIGLGWKRTAQLGFVGNFFNIALPGAVSGDVVKAVYVAREVQGHRARALSSILFDRVAGISALVLVAAGALIVSLGAPWGGRLFQAIQLFMGLAGIGVVAFYSYLFMVREHRDPLLKLFRRLEKKWSPFGSFHRIYEGLRTYHDNRKTVLQALAISAVIHVLIITIYLLLSRALGIHVPALAQFVLVPLGMLVTAIPIAPAGIGTGHFAFIALFGIMDSQRGGDLFTLFVIYKLLEGLTGGIVYLRFKSAEPAPTDAELAEPAAR